MTTDRLQRIHELFEKASAYPPEERETVIAESCGDDDELRSEVVSLLEHDERAPDDFMQVPSQPEINPDIPESPDPLLGRLIGKFRIKHVIATGGMGTVYEAEQDNPRRIVALKILRSGITSRYALRHFEYESKILARLRHANIAQVYEAGTFKESAAGGKELPYFAMEFVLDALPITSHADQKGLSTRERLGLFLPVCDAVQHGHQKGVIHRDLKPGNILVGEDGQVKVIDFGVARSTDSDIAVTTMRTAVGQIVGTLQYMSPEQCEADPLEIDSRSDVYSLGVVLYELLAGDLPYDVSRSSIHVAARVICEQEPILPSAVDRRLRGDLEAIVLKALAKNRDERYESAAALGDDIRRHLNREPIVARSPGNLLRACRAVTRHPILATLGLCLTILFGSLATTATIVRFYYTSPHKVIVSEDGRVAQLVSRGGRVLDETTVAAAQGILQAELVTDPEVLPGGPIVLISFNAQQSSRFAGALCALDPDQKLQDQEPIWTQSLSEDQMPAHLITERGLGALDTGVFHWELLDVFPDRPGCEIVAVYDVRPTTQTALRVYDLNGTLLYQTWMDFLTSHLYWMSDPRLLVMLGVNGSAYWPQRDHPEVQYTYPKVVFAIHLEDGLITTEYLSETPGSGPLEPAWYKCFLPAKAVDWTSELTLGAPNWRHDPTRCVRFALQVNDDNPGKLAWVLNAEGLEVPGSRVIADVFKRDPHKYPDPNKFHLGDLPPVVPQPERGDRLERPGDDDGS